MVALSLQVDQLTEEEIAKYKERFSQLDENDDGTISTKDLEADFPTRFYLQYVINKVDPDDNATINFSQFLTVIVLWVEIMMAEDNRELFHTYDKDYSGFISTAELKLMMTKLGDVLTWEEIYEMIEELDIDKDCQVSHSGISNFI